MIDIKCHSAVYHDLLLQSIYALLLEIPTLPVLVVW